jgi:two-component system, OmpR family, phosphate regulon sensor histidine kinase PhoR
MDRTTHNHDEQGLLWWIWTALALGVLFLSAFSAVLGFISAVGVLLIAVPVMLIRHQREKRSLRAEIEHADDLLRDRTKRTGLLADLIESADIPIVATDQDGRVVHVNRRGKDVLGITEQMMGRPFDELMTQGVLHALETDARTKQPGHARIALPLGGEMHEFDVSADPIERSGGAVLTFRDITELSRAMTLKADFVANASHELRTPIASIKGALETLAGPARNDELMSGRLIEMISTNADRLELLAADLLDLSKLEAEDQPTRIEQLDLRDLIAHIIDEYTPTAGRREIELETEIDEGLDEIRSDPMLLGLILRNLIGNAVKFAHERTRVRVRVVPTDTLPDRTTTIPAALDLPSGVSISVIDRGIGIPLTHQQRVFERFYQVDDARAGSGAKRGTGLGLAIVKHSARRLGGMVKLESIYQSGTTVTVELPRCVQNLSI